jgi:energy-converting hydrogenase Eha subunit A
MTSVKVRIYLFYVAAIFFVAIGLWMIGRGLFGDGGFTALVVGGLMFATGVIDYVMGSYLQKLYLQPSAPAQADTSGAASEDPSASTRSNAG